MNDNYQDLVINNIKLVWFVINKSKLLIPNYMSKYIDDLYQEGCIYLIKAAKNYDKTKGFEFSTYAVNYIQLGLMQFLNRHAKKRYLYEGLSLETEYSDKYSYRHHEITEDSFNEIIINNYIANINIKDMDKIIRLKLLGYNNQEIGKILGVTGMTIGKRLKKFKDLSNNIDNGEYKNVE